ncbi:hypothetical protein ESCO_000671 [Escovopsis weberi]|uniref:DUF7907 domain-containing protein n=1 Tax=Escovopsis weberi TaxID=150374 RepID=A0A0M8N1V0_ESCWE|nr:hypothetical protein ESCO_000671 [Escovopsis weberi]
MLFSILALGLAGLATASPIITDGLMQPSNVDPSKDVSKAFHLVVKHAKTPFDGLYINTYHVGAGIDLVGVGVGARETARIFYQNGTLREYHTGQSTILSDSGTPEAPFGLSLVRDVADGGEFNSTEAGSTTISTVYLSGRATRGVSVSRAPTILPGSYLICDEPVQYYAGKHLNILKNVKSPSDPIPEECTFITLVPECTQLNALPAGSFSSHDFALDTECYKNAATAQ